ncbi:hypothetical protein SMICM17S_03800 [Streptomyces microflavus]
MRLNDATDRISGLREAASAVRRGELVAPPTPCTGSVRTPSAPRASPTCWTPRGAGRNMPTPVLIGSPNTLHGLVTDFSEQAWELVDAFWPGALTLVAKHQPSLQWDLGDTRGTVAIRMPLHPVAIELLTEVGPMAVSSANLTGHPSPEDCSGRRPGHARRLRLRLPRRRPDARHRAVLDRERHRCGPGPPAGRCALRGGAAQGGTRPRGGQLTAPEGRGIAGRTDTFRILHVSTGNVCRSPITERLTHHVMDRLGDPLSGGLIVESAGTWGHEGAPMEANAEVVLADFGADASGFVGRELLDEHVIRADLVLTATRDHRAQVISMGHSAGLRTFTLKESPAWCGP